MLLIFLDRVSDYNLGSNVEYSGKLLGIWSAISRRFTRKTAAKCNMRNLSIHTNNNFVKKPIGKLQTNRHTRIYWIYWHLNAYNSKTSNLRLRNQFPSLALGNFGKRHIFSARKTVFIWKNSLFRFSFALTNALLSVFLCEKLFNLCAYDFTVPKYRNNHNNNVIFDQNVSKNGTWADIRNNQFVW